jgi:hypothetical protein
MAKKQFDDDIKKRFKAGTLRKPKVDPTEFTSQGRRILRGSQAQQYLTENPQADYRTVKDGQEYGFRRGDKGLIGNVAAGIVDPFANTARIGGQLVSDLASGGAPGRPQILTKEEQDNTPAFLARTAAGVGSYLIPGGTLARGLGGFGGAVASGALGGALGTAGATPLDREISAEDVAGGALVGGVLGGTFQQAGKVLSKASGRAAQKGVQETGEGLVLSSADDANAALERAMRMPQGGQRTAAVQDLVDNIAPDNPLRKSILNMAELSEGVTPSRAVTTATRETGEAVAGAGTRVRASRLGLDAKKLNMAPKELTRRGTQLMKTLDDFNLPTATKSQIANSTDEAISALVSQADEALVSAGKTVKTKGILDSVRSAFKNEPKLLNREGISSIFADLADLGDEVSVTQLNNFRRSLDQRLGSRAFQGVKLADKNRVLMEVRKGISNAVKKEAQGTRFSGVMDDLSNLLMLQDATLEAASKGTRVDFGPFLRVPLPGVGKAVEAGTDVAGRGISAAGRFSPRALTSRVDDALVGGLARVPGVGSPQAFQAAQLLGNQAVPQRVGALLGSSTGGAQPPVNTDAVQITGDPARDIEQYESVSTQGTAPDKMALFQMAMQMTGGDFGDALRLADYLGEDQEGSKEMSQNQGRAQFGLTGLSQLRNLLEGQDINLMSAQLSLPQFARSGEAQAYAQLRDQIAEAVGRLNSGGAINEEERIQFYRFVPGFGDTPETAALKLQELEGLFNSYF